MMNKQESIDALELKLAAARKDSNIVLLIELCQQMENLMGFNHE